MTWTRRGSLLVPGRGSRRALGGAGSGVVGGGGGGQGGGGDPGSAPTYSASNSDHKLHLDETWGSLSAIANIAIDTRSDGGQPWADGGITQNFGSGVVGTLVDAPDPFGSVRHLSIEYGIDPPINTHGTGNHAAAKHWYGGGYAGNGYAGDVFDAQGDDNADPNNDNSAPGDSRNNRGIILGNTTYLNTPPRTSVVYEWSVRMRNVNGVIGKEFDINAGLGTGPGRWNYGNFDSLLGWSGTPTNAIATIYYDANGDVRAAYNGIVPPRFDTCGLNINRDYGSAIGTTGASTHFFKQNLNWGLGAGKWAYGGYQVWPLASPNADMLGTSTPVWQAGWLRFKLRLTACAAGQSFGNGRVEMWVTSDAANTTLKVMEYYGDVGQLHAGNIYVTPNATDSLLAGNIDVYQLLSRTYTGGAIVDIGRILIWSHTRETL